MNEKENDVLFSFNQKKLSISVFKQLDGSLIFFKEENTKSRIQQLEVRLATL